MTCCSLLVHLLAVHILQFYGIKTAWFLYRWSNLKHLIDVKPILYNVCKPTNGCPSMTLVLFLLKGIWNKVFCLSVCLFVCLAKDKRKKWYNQPTQTFCFLSDCFWQHLSNWCKKNQNKTKNKLICLSQGLFGFFVFLTIHWGLF